MLRTEQLANHFKMISSRLRTFRGIIQTLLLCHGCRLKDFAAGIQGNANLDSKIKSVTRFLSGNHIAEDDFIMFVSRFIPDGKIALAIDRTIWEFGKEIRNVLVLAVSFDKIAMPVMFTIIPYKGASTGEDQVEILDRFIKSYGKNNIKVVTADREFDNKRFIKYLGKQGINFAVRLKKNSRVTIGKAHQIRLQKLPGILRNYQTSIYGVAAKLDHKRLVSGEFLSVVSSLSSENGFDLYRRRWDIESAFKACKSAGFRMEETNLRNSHRLKNYIKCIFIAFAITIKAGYLANKKKAIKVKTTLKCKAYSLVQYGIRTIKSAFSRSRAEFMKLIFAIIRHRYGRQDLFVR